MNYEELTSSSTAPQQVTASPQRCRVLSASYGGKKTLLVRTRDGAETRYTALTVLAGFERSMFDNYLKAQGRDGANLGEFASKRAALAKARELCPDSGPEREAKAAG
jgi:hypothetical protein